VKRYLVFIFFIACHLVASAQGTVTIKGVIQNQLSDSIAISFNNNRLIYEPVNYNEELDKGSFKYTFKVKEEYTPVTIRHGRLFTELIVQPGDDLSMEAVILDSALSITYTGKGSDRANFLAKHAIDMGLVDRYPSKMQAYLKADPSTFIKKVNEDELKELLYLQKNKAGLTPSFVRYLETAYRYFSYFCLYQYPLMHEVAMSNGYNFSSIPKQNYTTVKNIPAIFNDSFLHMVPYRLYADQFYRMQMEVAGYFNDTVHVFRVQDSIARMALKNMPPATAEYVIALHLYAAIRILPIDTAADRIAKFKKRWPNSQYKELIDAQFAIVKRLAPGEKAYDFAFTTPQGKTGHLSDLKGKIVFLGFWSSSNRQNIVEMKAAAQMAAKYKDKDIVFLYVSLDEDDATWLQAIEQHRLQGIHCRENGSWNSFLAKIYGIQSLPTFFLLDREGKFTLKQTPMPSQSGFMVQVVDKLLSTQ
jgi:hypothetical protein